LNKVDGVPKEEKDKVVKEMRELCKKLEVAHVEVSAQTGDNVENMFYILSETMLVTRPF